ncbi:MAG: hypothetical protein IKT44_00015, partial [Clostridia bacterium]|nr:hypothetical protein [Clostridia bacterium]
MKNTFKKLISVILCAVLLFTTASVAFAAEENQEEVLEKGYTCHFYYSMDFFVVTFDSKYSQIGEEPKVRLYNGSYIYPLGEDAITLKVFENE